MKRSTIVWLYDKDHLSVPMIPVAAATLVDAAYDVFVIDTASAPAVGAPYRHIALGSSGSARRVSAHTSSEITGSLLAPKRRRRGRRFARSLFNLVKPIVKRATSPSARAAAVRRLRELRFRATVLVLILSIRPIVVLASSPATAQIASTVRRLLGIRLVYYPYELYGEQVYGDARKHPEHAKGLSLERRLLAHAVDAVITQNSERAGVYRLERGSRVEPVIVHNYKPTARPPVGGRLRQRLQLPLGSRIVLYEGILGDGRWLAELILAARHLDRDTRLVFMGPQGSWWTDTAEPLISRENLVQRISVLEEVPHSELLEYVADADVGIIIYDNSVRNNYFCEPGKLSDYVLGGVPIVAPDFPTIGPVISRYGIGATFGSPDPWEIAAAIMKVLETRKEDWQSRLRHARQDLVWETQAPNFLGAVQDAIRTRIA